MDLDAATRLLISRAQSGEFRGAVVLARRGTVFLRQGYGLASEEWQIRNTPTTKFRIGSVTKQFTAASVLRLVAAGALDLHGGIAVALSDAILQHAADLG
jgi:CubicO group peptidase (beta-lactamase class C family)